MWESSPKKDSIQSSNDNYDEEFEDDDYKDDFEEGERVFLRAKMI